MRGKPEVATRLPTPSDQDLVTPARLLRHYDSYLHFHTGPLLEALLHELHGAKALDLGCGDGRGAEWLRSFGLEAIGLDTQAATMGQVRGDGHLLPFKDHSFSVILSLKVLEHVRDPLCFLREIHRVMKPDALFLGSVAFLEPYHARSYFHFSPLALADSLSRTGFRVLELQPGHSALSSLFSTAFPVPRLSFPFPIIKPFAGLLQAVLLSVRRVSGFAYATLRHKMREYRREVSIDRVRFAGEFSFLAERS